MRKQKFSKSIKLKVVRDRLVKKLSVGEIMAKHKGLSRSTIYRWIKLYRREVELENMPLKSELCIYLHLELN